MKTTFWVSFKIQILMGIEIVMHFFAHSSELSSLSWLQGGFGQCLLQTNNNSSRIAQYLLTQRAAASCECTLLSISARRLIVVMAFFTVVDFLSYRQSPRDFLA